MTQNVREDSSRERLVGATCPRNIVLLTSIYLLLSLTGCGNLFEDNGTHLAFALERGAKELRSSNASEWTVHYETLDGPNTPYYVEITDSTARGQSPNVWSSYLVVSGKTSGGTSYHNRFVYVPQRLFIEKKFGGTIDVILRKEGDHISVVDIR